MVASQNGWRANDRSVISTRTVPGTGVRLAVRNGAPGDLLLEVAARFDREVEDIDGGQVDDWGYAERPIRGGTELSNHASGTAIDLNAPRHPLGKAGTFSRAQVDAIHRIIAATGNVVRWGGDYTGRKDEMHFEINDGRTEEQCARALAALRGAAGPPAPPSGPSGGNLANGSRGPKVEELQRVLAAWYPDLRLAVDGVYGPATEAAVRRVQQNTRGLEVDGIAGPKTLAALRIA